MKIGNFENVEDYINGKYKINEPINPLSEAMLDEYFNIQKLRKHLKVMYGEKANEALHSIVEQIDNKIPPENVNFLNQPIPQDCLKKKYIKKFYKDQLKDRNEQERAQPNPIRAFFIANFMENVERFYEHQPFFYDRAGQFWFWNDDEKRYRESDEVDLMNSLEVSYNLSGQTISSSMKSQYLEAFRRVGRRNIPKELPANFIQFNSTLYDLETKNESEVTPKYFLTNPIPWDLGGSEETPILDRLFTEWVGAENKQVLYEIMAYCCYRDYPIHLIFALVGSGRNGKSQYQKLMSQFLGKDNVSSTELDSLIENRFESIKLYRKLAVQMGETNFGVMSKTSLIKKLSGQDLIGFERKNQKPFDDYNYAKILINSNSLPSSEDTSEGFYRRWFIVSFPNDFKEGKDVYTQVPKEEFNNLARKIIRILSELLDRGNFSAQGTIEQRKDKYIEFSNPLAKFLEQGYVRDPEGYIRYGKLHQDYVQYLSKKKMRIVSWKEFSQSLSREGFEYRRTNKKVGEEFVSDRWIEGLRERRQNEPKEIQSHLNCDSCDKCDHTSTPYPLYVSPSESTVTKDTIVTKTEELVEETYTSSPKDLILAFIRARQNDFDLATGQGRNGTDVLKACEQLGFGYELLKQMSSEGLIFESPLDHWRVL